MKKVFVYLGSNNKKSTAFDYIIKLKERVDEMALDFDIHWDIYTPHVTDILYCTGCISCFKLGKCPLDVCDSMAEIKQKMIESDFIIFGSPVYAHNVSGHCKVFIDRISYWMHLFRLGGKAGFTLVSTSNNGMDIVTNILESALTYMGVETVGNIMLTMMNQHFDKNIDMYTKIMISYLTGEAKVKSNDLFESIFKVQKFSFLNGNKNDSEFVYWEKNGFLEAMNYQELLDKKFNNGLD